MARNDKTGEVEGITELIPVEGNNNLLTKETEIDADEYTHFLAIARKLPDYKRSISIASRYYEFTKPGESVRGIFMGTTTIKKKDVTGELIDLECVQWMAADGCLYVNAGTALVNTFRQFLPPRGCPIEITYEAKKERTKLYDVRILTN